MSKDGGHYVGYIFDKDIFLFHDGLPETKPVLKTYIMSQIHGDISLLVYFHVNTNNNGDKNTNDVMSESSAVNIQMMNQDVDVSDIKATGNDTYNVQ